MRKDKQSAIILRKTGLSYNQITEKLKIPKSTLSTWLKNIDLDQNAQAKINSRVNATSVAALIKRNKLQTVIAKENARQLIEKSKKEFKNKVNNKLFLTAVSLYWAEGYKKGIEGSKYKAVDFTNSNVAMIKLMLRFFLENCGIKKDKLRIQVIAHHNININRAIKFWQNITGLKQSQFQKSSLAPKRESKKPRQNQTLPNGTIHLRISDVNFFHTMIGWIEGLKEYHGL
jgi:hypothetical protein